MTNDEASAMFIEIYEDYCNGEPLTSEELMCLDNFKKFTDKIWSKGTTETPLFDDGDFKANPAGSYKSFKEVPVDDLGSTYNPMACQILTVMDES